MSNNSFRQIVQQEREDQIISRIKCGLCEVYEGPSVWTLNQIISDLSSIDEYLDTFIKILKIDGKEFFEVDKELLDKPLSEIKDLISFNGKNFSDFIKNEELEKISKNLEIQDKEFSEEKIKSIQSNIKTENLKIIRRFGDFLKDLGFDEEERKLIFYATPSFNDEGCNADLFLMDIYSQHECALEWAFQSLENCKDQEKINGYVKQIKILKKFLKVCPNDIYYVYDWQDNSVC